MSPACVGAQCVLLLAVEVLLGWLAAGVLLDSACVSAGSLCVVADS